MISSTSNSDSQEPRWGRVWVFVVVFAAVIVGGWEILVRSAGLGPAYTDNQTLWADTRHRLNQYGDEAIILLGASRMQRAVDVETMSRHFGRPVFQLSLEGTSYLPLLENLAADPRISGSVVVSLAPAFTFNRLLSQLDKGVQSIYLKYYSDQSYARRLEQRLSLVLQGVVGFRAPDASLARVIPVLLETGSMPGPDFKTTYRDRVVHIDYDAMRFDQNDDRIAGLYLGNTKPYTAQEFDAVVNYIATLVRLLRQKGADVYFVRLPSSGAVRSLEGAFFPKEQFWEVLKGRVDATFIHYDDYSELKGYMSVDGSHVESTHMPTFTRLLSDVLARNQLQAGSAAQVSR